MTSQSRADQTTCFKPALRRRRYAIKPVSLGRLFRRFASWWADDSMNARFEQQRARDLQMLHRHDKRQW